MENRFRSSRQSEVNSSGVQIRKISCGRPTHLVCSPNTLNKPCSLKLCTFKKHVQELECCYKVNMELTFRVFYFRKTLFLQES